MVVEDRFDINRRIIVDKNTTTFSTSLDMSLEASNDIKIEKVLNLCVDSLSSMGFDAITVIEKFLALANKVYTNPDNQSYEVDSAVEEHVNEKKNLEEFIFMFKESLETEDRGFIKAVYRAWLISEVDKTDSYD